MQFSTQYNATYKITAQESPETWKGVFGGKKIR